MFMVWFMFKYRSGSCSWYGSCSTVCQVHVHGMFHVHCSTIGQGHVHGMVHVQLQYSVGQAHVRGMVHVQLIGEKKRGIHVQLQYVSFRFKVGQFHIQLQVQ